MAVDPKHRYLNEAERANLDIYDDLKVFQRFNPLPAKLFKLNFHPLEVVSR